MATKRLCFALLALATALWSVRDCAAGTHFQVLLDQATFDAGTYDMMQGTANQVVNVVEQLMPEASQEGTTVLCFAAPPDWHAPITVTGRPYHGEPLASAQYPVRVALSRDVLPADRDRFAFQLAHELAHVKMDPHFDNAMVETFAVAVSFEVMDRLGRHSYLRATVDLLIAPLPPTIKAAVQEGSWSIVTAYLASRQNYYQQNPFDYSLAAAGALLIRSGGVTWRRLVGIARTNTCAGKEPTPTFRMCDLDESKLVDLTTIFRALGAKE